MPYGRGHGKRRELKTYLSIQQQDIVLETQCAKDGFSDGQIAALLGHTNTKTTKRYTHLQVEHLRDMVQCARAHNVRVLKLENRRDK